MVTHIKVMWEIQNKYSAAFLLFLHLHFAEISPCARFIWFCVHGNLTLVEWHHHSTLHILQCLLHSWWWRRTPGWGLKSSRPLNNCSCHMLLKWTRPSCRVWPPSTGPPLILRNTWTESLLHSVRLSSWPHEKAHKGGMVKRNSKYFFIFSNSTLLVFSWLVEELDLLLHRVNDMVEFRIDAVLHEMSTTTLCVIPEDEPCTCEEFVNTTKVGSHLIYSKSVSEV